MGFLGGREDKLSFLAIIRTIWKERNRCCFEGLSSFQLALVDKVKFPVASWAVILPSFQDILIATILSNWNEVALSSPTAPTILPRWSPAPLGALKLKFDGSALGTGAGWYRRHFSQ